MNFKLIIIFIFIGLFAFLYESSNKSPENLITKNVSEMIPNLVSEPKIEELNDSYAKFGYLFYFGFDAMELKCEINKYSSVQEAEDNYNIAKQQYPNSQEISLGSEGFGIEKKSDSIVVFRKANVIVKTELDGKYSTLDQTINYAKKVKV